MRYRLCVFLGLFVAAPALADELETEGVPVEEEPQAPQEASEGEPGKLRWAGRVFVGDLLTRQRIAGQTHWRNKQGVNSARIGLSYKHKSGMRAVIKLEFEDGDPELKDAYVRLAPASVLQVKAGRFKRPMSSIALASRYSLPSITRGLLDSLRIEGQELPFAGGRGDGLIMEYTPLASPKLQLSVGVFQNDLGKGAVSLDASEHVAQDAYVRASLLAMDDLQIASSLGLFGYLEQGGDPDSFSHAPVGSLEVTYGGKLMQLWVEGFVGKNMLAKVDGSTSGTLVGGRALVAASFRTGTPRRLQPYLGASYFDPRRNEAEDANSEVQGGINLAFTKIWRLQFEVAHTLAEGSASSAIEGTAFRVQLGAKFKE